MWSCVELLKTSTFSLEHLLHFSGHLHGPGTHVSIFHLLSSVLLPLGLLFVTHA